MSNKKKLIPALRFPEFKEDGEWEEKALNEIAILIKTKNLKGTITNVFTNSAVYGIVDQSDYFDKEIANQKNIENYYIVEDGDYVYNPRISSEAPVGPVSKNNTGKPGAMSPLYTVFRFLNRNNLFFEYYFTTRHWYNGILRVANSGARFDRISITDSALLKIEVFNPGLEEQQKIADCLSSLDDLLAAHNEKLELLKGHKKGLMQNLFPQEGERVPKFRFPEFENDGEWEEKKLGEVAEFSKGKGISKADIIDGGALPCIRYGELYTYYNETISEVKSFTNEGKENLVLSKANDVIIPASGETQIDIATASCVLREGIALGGDLNIIRTQINGVFLAYYLNNAKKYEIAQMAQGVSVIHLYPTQLQTLTTCLPGKSEQQKIASCLSAVDDLIKAETEKIEALKEHKKGLMQGLFPKMEN